MMLQTATTNTQQMAKTQPNERAAAMQFQNLDFVFFFLKIIIYLFVCNFLPSHKIDAIVRTNNNKKKSQFR